MEITQGLTYWLRRNVQLLPASLVPELPVFPLEFEMMKMNKERVNQMSSLMEIHAVKLRYSLPLKYK